MLTKIERDSWASALRNPDIEQTTSTLFSFLDSYGHPISAYGPRPDNAQLGFCCLGVYCWANLGYDIDVIESYDMPSSIYSSDGDSAHIDDALAGMYEDIYDFVRDLSSYEFDVTPYLDEPHRTEKRKIVRGEDAFAYMNDSLGWSFARIANVISLLPTKN